MKFYLYLIISLIIPAPFIFMVIKDNQHAWNYFGPLLICGIINLIIGSLL